MLTRFSLENATETNMQTKHYLENLSKRICKPVFIWKNSKDRYASLISLETSTTDRYAKGNLENSGGVERSGNVKKVFEVFILAPSENTTYISSGGPVMYNSYILHTVLQGGRWLTKNYPTV
jgi:hypothetical protein